MPDSRKARSVADPGLQPERTSLAWFRTLLGCGALMALMLKYNQPQAEALFWVYIAVLATVAIILWRYSRSLILLDVVHYNFSEYRVVFAKLMISLAVLSLAILFAVTHIRQIIDIIRSFTVVAH
ncbi:DUF202 domain-containing protein [Erwinia sp. S38]|uniref:DUF202 domain-containing protein n=1 Tax=Erwinia sp. S38 TaxID=2769338 RepID=UPI00190DBE30|nr:DUF202 domain-containing protein [Erwinia sp. S38]MBK0004770.1 DUF202 domain-containing protein [Erwinia sp. S38]